MNIKISQHTIKFANKNKLDNLVIFINEYRKVSKLLVDYIWNNGNC